MRQSNVWLFVLALIAWPASSLAHGSGTPQLVNRAAGPYVLSVWSLPEPLRVGEAHLTVAVRTPADDLVVQLQLTPIEPAGNSLVQTTVIQDRLLQRYYEADLVLPSAGVWQATVMVQGAIWHKPRPSVNRCCAPIARWMINMASPMCSISRLG